MLIFNIVAAVLNILLLITLLSCFYEYKKDDVEYEKELEEKFSRQQRDKMSLIKWLTERK